MFVELYILLHFIMQLFFNSLEMLFLHIIELVIYCFMFIMFIFYIYYNFFSMEYEFNLILLIFVVL